VKWFLSFCVHLFLPRKQKRSEVSDQSIFDSLVVQEKRIGIQMDHSSAALRIGDPRHRQPMLTLAIFKADLA
jgi:hypothetical protein